MRTYEAKNDYTFHAEYIHFKCIAFDCKERLQNVRKIQINSISGSRTFEKQIYRTNNCVETMYTILFFFTLSNYNKKSINIAPYLSEKQQQQPNKINNRRI